MRVANHIDHYSKDAEYFNYFDGLNKIESDFSKRIHESITGQLKDGKTILDIGSGGGWVAGIKKKFTGITLVDLSLKNLSELKRGNSGIKINCIIADALSLPFKNESYDYIILSEVLEHLNEPEAALSGIYDALRKDGKAIITTPYNEIIRYYLCIHCNKKTPANAHLHVFNEVIMSKILKNTGIDNFEFDKIGNQYFLKFRLSYLLKFLPFGLWKIIDKFFNLLVNKPYTIITIINKK